jgi:hypothetical protein
MLRKCSIYIYEYVQFAPLQIVYPNSLLTETRDLYAFERGNVLHLPSFMAIQKGKRVDYGQGFYIGFIVVLYARELNHSCNLN